MRAWVIRLLLTIVASGATGCASTPTRVERAGLVGRRVQARERSALVGGRVPQPGDVVLQSAALHVLVGGNARTNTERGSVLEVRLRGADAYQSLSHWSFGLSVNDARVPLTLSDLSLMERAGLPRVRIRMEGELNGRAVHVDRELGLSSVDGVLSVATSVWTDEGEPIVDARIVERMDWEGATPFAPGVGDLDDEVAHHVPWLARDGKSSAVVFGYAQGLLDVRTTLQVHGADRLPGVTRARSPVATVTPGTALRMQAFVALANGGVSDALRRFGWARGRPFAEASVAVPYQPAGTLIRLYDAAGAVQVHGRPQPDRRLVMPLPDTMATEPSGVFTIAATAWGHAATTPIGIRAGESVTLNVPRGGSVRVLVHDREGQAMPGRIRFESLDKPKTTIDLGPDHNAGGARDAVITLDGDVEVPLMPGRYRVRVSRGPEYEVHEQTVHVTKLFQPQVRASLEHVVAPGPWIGSDFHIHSAPSPDSEVTLDDRVASLVAEGVRFAVPTEHDWIGSLREARDHLGVTDLGTVSGVEATTMNPSIGHFNAYPFPLNPTQPRNGALDVHDLTATQIFDQLHAISEPLLVQVNHPRMEGGIGYFDAYAYDPATGHAKAGFSEAFDVLEVWNGFDLARPDVYERGFQEWLAILARGKRVVAVGNSDSHLVRYQWVGYPRTWINAPAGPGDSEAVIAALTAGRAFVSDGPFLEVTVGDRGLGDMVPVVDGKVTVHVQVQAPAWMDVTTLELWVGTERVLSEAIAPQARQSLRQRSPHADLPALRVRRDVELPIARDSTLVVRVRGDRPMDDYFGRAAILPIAFSNPIFVDGDGDGRVPWLHGEAPALEADVGRAQGLANQRDQGERINRLHQKAVRAQ